MMALDKPRPSVREDDEGRGFSVKRIFPKLAFGMLLSAGTVYLLVQRIDIERLADLAGEIHFTSVALAVLVYWCSLFARACRWKVLLGQAPNARLLPLFVAYLIGAGFNTLIPAKVGELLRMQISSRWLQMSRLRLAGGIFIEKCQDMLILLGFFAGGIYFLANQNVDPALLRKILSIAAVLLAGAVLGLVALFFFYPRLLKRMQGNGIALTIDRFVSGIAGALTTGIMRNLTLTFAIWAMDLSTLWMILHSVRVDLQILELMLLTGAYSFVSLVPSAPVHLGTYQAAFVFVFAILGYSAESAFLGALLVQAALLIPVTLFAVILSFWFWQDFFKVRRP
jgi:uncharacterized membrane protein YbhN (UPF0104 family)